MSERVPYATKVDSEYKATLIKLSEITRIPQSKLVDEALEDLFKKYAEQLEKGSK
ncbi:hypothetical protein QFZ77_002430 [Paenibacillus sp. V4I3]|uniref:ribbon-helix-helix domain-containing protein n=1 Tax=Paenibacillus sp. V4I3 TaxID=3042305 RepID=UPI00278B61B8|nr:ribbon-helix-helix domain-containing protein [Paenibacillus sp. V4I3]MDQ0873771.1 hypothetical protein [Paenibacillus sp. V4I3]